MIFDNTAATAAYMRYYNDNDPKALAEFVELCRPLAGSAAWQHRQLGDSQFTDDLVQAGLLKCYQIILNKRYTPGRSKVYHLVQRSMHNAMIDELRKRSKTELTDETCMDDAENLLSDEQYHLIGQSTVYRNGDSPDDIAEFQQQAVAYSIKRFPSIPTMSDVSPYVCEAILDGCIPVKIINTVRAVYDIKYSKCVYDAIRARFAAELAHRQVFEDAAIAAVNKRTEFTSKPEWCLILGPTVYRELQYYVRRI